jgi:hypothetical protein
VLIEGKAGCQRYLLDMFDDWQAEARRYCTRRRGRYANNIRAVRGWRDGSRRRRSRSKRPRHRVRHLRQRGDLIETDQGAAR